jgi:excinuclease UvrABC helicase subunit UvrB
MIEMMQEVGYVNGIENYNRYLDGRALHGNPAQTLMGTKSFSWNLIWLDFLKFERCLDEIGVVKQIL